MEFRRINGLPPYVFAHIDALKLGARRAGRDVIDLGFGNPDIASPDVAVEKLAEAVRNPRNHRYSASRGIPKLRQAISALYMRRFGVEIDPDTEAVVTIGAKEGLSHLMWVLLGPGDSVLVPSPSYPIHIYAPLFAGAEVRQVRLEDPGRPEGGTAEAFFDNLMESWESAWPKPRVVVLSFPHNPTTSCVDLAWMTRMVEFAREHDVVLVHDFAYADIAFDGYRPPSILEVPGAKDCAVELYTLTKSFSMAGWRVGFLVGNAEVVQALTKLKSYLDYGTFQPIQIAAIVAMNEAPDFPKVVNDIYQAPTRRAVRRSQPDRVERRQAEGDDVRVGSDPRALQGDGIARVLVVPRASPPRSPPHRASDSDPVATVTSVSRSSRTSSGSARPCETCVGRSRSCRAHRELSGAEVGALSRLPAQAVSEGGRRQDAFEAERDRRVAASMAGLPWSSTSARASCWVTPKMACAMTIGSSRRTSPAAIAAFTCGSVSATACSSPWRMIGAKRSSVRASSSRPKRLRLSSSQLIVARIPCSIRRNGSGSSASAWRWQRRRSRCASRRIWTKSASLDSKYQ